MNALCYEIVSCYYLTDSLLLIHINLYYVFYFYFKLRVKYKTTWCFLFNVIFIKGEHFDKFVSSIKRIK